MAGGTVRSGLRRRLNRQRSRSAGNLAPDHGAGGQLPQRRERTDAVHVGQHGPGIAPLLEQGFERAAQSHPFQLGVQGEHVQRSRAGGRRETEHAVSHVRFIDAVASEELIEGGQRGGNLRAGARPLARAAAGTPRRRACRSHIAGRTRVRARARER